MRAATASSSARSIRSERWPTNPLDRPRQRGVSGQGRLVRRPEQPVVDAVLDDDRLELGRAPRPCEVLGHDDDGVGGPWPPTPGAGPSRRRDHQRRARGEVVGGVEHRPPLAGHRRTPATPSPRPSRRRRRRAGAPPAGWHGEVSRSVARAGSVAASCPGRPPASARRAARRAAGAWVPPAPVPIRGGGEPRSTRSGGSTYRTGAQRVSRSAMCWSGKRLPSHGVEAQNTTRLRQSPGKPSGAPPPPLTAFIVAMVPFDLSRNGRRASAPRTVPKSRAERSRRGFFVALRLIQRRWYVVGSALIVTVVVAYTVMQASPRPIAPKAVSCSTRPAPASSPTR